MIHDQSSFDFAALADFVVQFLAVAYGVFATATDFKETAPDGKKHLSKTGKMGIAFLIVISIASIGVKIYQHAKDSKAKSEAQAAQQKMVQDLEQSLSNSRTMSNALADANAKLTSQAGMMTHEADILKQQTAKMGDLMEGSQKIIHASTRILDPLDDSFNVYVRESLKRSEPALEPYLHRIGSPEYQYVDSKNSQNWPKEEDGDFGKYANWRDLDVRVYPISELRQVVYPKRYKGSTEYQLHAAVVCTTPDQRPSSQVSVHIFGPEVILECRAGDVNWTKNGDIRAYVDLRNSFLIVWPSTPTAVREYAPPLRNLEVDIMGKNHSLDATNFYVIPCPLQDKETCYISRMPRDY
jgi:hypothetical protein